MAVLVIVSVSVMTFFIARVVPSDPAAAWVGPHPTKEQIQRVTRELGLDKPLTTQYVRYAEDLLRGDLGTSVTTRRPILEDVKVFLPATLELVMVAMALAILLGIPLGVLSGARKGSVLDHATRLISIAGISVPTFFLGLLLQLFLFGKLGLLPLGGRLSTYVALNHPIVSVTGFLLIDSAIAGNWVAFRDAAVHLIMPGVVLATYPVGLVIRMTRSTMIEVLSEKYILAAETLGVPRRIRLFVLALKNAVIPTLSALALSFVFSLTGSILIEVIFSWPGLGAYVTNAVLAVDFPVIVSVTLIVTLFYVVINLVLDLVQAALDPRVVLE
ncbi:MAG: ABC transporter permease subunit [Gammaproteobacteria bacterium]|nr:ABC transporter permease subunit [Gammaproteobacteria bacterium]